MTPAVHPILAPAVLAWALALVLSGQEGGGPAVQPGWRDYGATPDAFRPYRRLGPVYWRFFESPPPYRGIGRTVPPPPGLRSLRIGLMVPLEGTGETEIGRAVERGVTLAFEEQNARGGLDGLSLELVVRNDASVWGDSSNTVVELAYGEKVWALIGSVDAASTHVALRTALKAELPIVNTACTDPTLTETGIPWILRCYPDDRQHGYRLARIVFLERGFERVAVLRSNDKYGRMGVAEFSDAARRLGHPIAVEVRFSPGEKSFGSQLARIRRTGVDAVVLWGPSRDAGRIVAEMRALGMEEPVFGNDRLVTASFLSAAGDAAEGVVATTPMDPRWEGEAWRGFQDRFRRRFGVEPDAFAAFSFDGARILLGAIERAGANRARIRDELAGVRTFTGLLGPMFFDPTHNNLGTIHVVQVRDGSFKRIEGL